MPKKHFIPQQWEACSDENCIPICNKVYSGDCGNDRDNDVERIVSLIEQQSADIAPSYEEWVKLGFALVDGYGENGRDYFMRLSTLHAGCTQEAAESQYDKCLRSGNSGITISTFFHLVKNAGISISIPNGKMAIWQNGNLRDHADKQNNAEISKSPNCQDGNMEISEEKEAVKVQKAERLLDMLSFDFFQVLDAVTIARSRKHIEKYYDTADIGKFPTRLKPISKRPHLTDLDEAITYRDIASQLDELNLSVYAPSDYILPSMRSKYEIDKDDSGGHLGMSGREKGLKKLMAINLLKRLESSVNSFRLTLERMKSQVDETLKAIDTFMETRQDTRLSLQTLESMLDGDDSENDFLVGGKKTRVSLADMDCRSWKRDLAADQYIIDLLLVMLRDITPEHDSKLQMLIENLREKFAHPINGDNKKVLIFTAFSDTAEYLYDNLAPAIMENAGLHTGLVTGNEVASTIKGLRADFNSILTLFSPISKEADKLLPDTKERIDVLIATDCISEGQNLQDCDYLINYDIHWNPVRIIQRFGRVDRIGSRNDVIQLVNYWPDIELDDYLRLKGRVEARMTGVNITGAGNSNVLLSDEEQADLDYRKNQLQRLQEEVVDLEDMDTGINIMDLGVNEFRMDLLAYMHEHPDIEHTPLGMSAVVPASEVVKPGVIFNLKNRNNAVNIGRQNLLHPFYMVYLSDGGEPIINHLSPKRLLDIMRLSCKGRTEPIKELCHAFNKETADGRKMQHYSELLQKAVGTIVEQKEESDLESLFSFGETTALVNDIKGLDDFELICFLVIKEGGDRG